MAGGNTREIKARMRSIESTRKITKAMGLVASSKLIRAKERVERSRPYFSTLYQTLEDIAASNRELSSPYFPKAETKASCFILIGGDRGLAGGYNVNLLKQAEEAMAGKNARVLPIGKKCLEYCERKQYDILSRQYAVAAEITVGNCFEISRRICQDFLADEYDEVILVFTNFISILEQKPASLNLLPLRQNKQAADEKNIRILYEPDSEEVFNAIVPEYVAGLIYGALCEAQASELGARHTAMDAASKNAEEMLESLELHFNRERQRAITQEITEIVAGAGE